MPCGLAIRSSATTAQVSGGFAVGAAGEFDKDVFEVGFLGRQIEDRQAGALNGGEDSANRRVARPVADQQLTIGLELDVEIGERAGSWSMSSASAIVRVFWSSRRTSAEVVSHATT